MSRNMKSVTHSTVLIEDERKKSVENSRNMEHGHDQRRCSFDQGAEFIRSEPVVLKVSDTLDLFPHSFIYKCSCN